MHLDTNYVFTPRDFVGLAPTSTLCARLSSALNPGLEEIDDDIHPIYNHDRDGLGLGSGSGSGAEFGFGHGFGDLSRGTAAQSSPSEGTVNKTIFLFGEFVSELLQGAAESTFEVGQGPKLSVLFDEQLYKRAKAAAAEASERYYERRRWLSGGRGGGARSGGPLYNRHCGPLLDQFVKTQMLSHFLSEGTWHL